MPPQARGGSRSPTCHNEAIGRAGTAGHPWEAVIADARGSGGTWDAGDAARPEPHVGDLSDVVAQSDDDFFGSLSHADQPFGAGPGPDVDVAPAMSVAPWDDDAPAPAWEPYDPIDDDPGFRIDPDRRRPPRAAIYAAVALAAVLGLVLVFALLGGGGSSDAVNANRARQTKVRALPTLAPTTTEAPTTTTTTTEQTEPVVSTAPFRPRAASSGTATPAPETSPTTLFDLFPTSPPATQPPPTSPPTTQPPATTTTAAPPTTTTATSTPPST